MAAEIDKFPKCAICSEPAAQVCGGCRKEHYCGRIHQKQAWRAGHRNKCSSFRLEINEQFGRHFVATRDIKQGETIFKEKPAILGPKIVVYPTCLSCYKRVKPTIDKTGKMSYNMCSMCEWPMCNEECQSAKVHREECELMTSRKFKSSVKYQLEDKRESAYCVIAPLRCLLMQKNDPIQYEAIMNLESHLEERINTPLYRILKANIVTFVQQVLGLTQFDEETILKVAAILDTNAFDIRNLEKDKKLRGIYLTASMLQHDCVPNTKHVFLDKDYCMGVIATVPITKGTVISTSYTQPLWGTLTRRAHLQNVKCFWCSCQRCSDPKELGTYAGAIYCSKCHNPTKDPKDIPKIISVDPGNNSADWKCEACEHKIPANQMVWGNNAIKKDIGQLDHANLKSFEEFIVKYERALHPSNSHILQVKYALCQMYGHHRGFTYNDINDAAVNRKIQLCEELMDIFDVIQPGFTQARGMILLELQEALLIRARRELASTKITKEAAQDLMGECMVMLKEASDILKSEPDVQDILKERLENLALELDE